MRLGRILIALVIVGAVVAAGAYWIGPGVVPRAELRLLALDADSRFAEVARLPGPDAAGTAGQQPLILAVSNVGARESGVLSISLSVPGWIRLYQADGPIEPVEDATAEPLRRYDFTLGGEPIEPGALPQVPAGLDRMWVAADVPAITCAVRWDGVPELTPAPPWDTGRLDSVSVFYSIIGDRHRHTGVLGLGLDPGAFARGPSSFSAGDPVIRRPGAAVPPTDSLTLHGEREATCGSPGRRVELRVAVWRTVAGRLWIITHDSLPRRILYDADGDGMIEREAWDGDADGLFEASRTASYSPPPWLIPADTPVIAPARADSTAARPDSATVPPAARDTTPPPPDAAGTAAVDTTAGTDTLPIAPSSTPRSPGAIGLR